jgi:hypothetical protein
MARGLTIGQLPDIIKIKASYIEAVFDEDRKGGPKWLYALFI